MAGGAQLTGFFIDAENVNGAKLGAWFPRLVSHGERLGLFGAPSITRAYAGWTKPELVKFHSYLNEQQIEIVDVVSANGKTPNAADIHLAVDVVAESYRRADLQSVVLFSGDGGLVPLVHHLREMNRTVVGVGLSSTASPKLIEACNDFVLFQSAKKEYSRAGSTLLREQTSSWYAAVVEEVDRLHEEAPPVPLAALLGALGARFGPATLAAVAPLPDLVGAVTLALEETDYVLWRLDDEELWQVALRASVPSWAIVRDMASSHDGAEGVFLSADSSGLLNDSDMPNVEQDDAAEAVTATRIVLPDDEFMLDFVASSWG